MGMRTLRFALVLALLTGVSLSAFAQVIVNPPSGGGSGGTGTPAGSTGSVQYNAGGGNFGGIVGATTDGTTLTMVAPVLGTPASVNLSNATALPLATGVTGVLPFANFVNASAASKLVGRGSASGAGVFQEITIGSGLSMSGTTLSSTTTGTPGGSTTQCQYNNASAFGGVTGCTTNGTTITLVAPILGTPASATLTNATGLPISTGVSGLGSGAATFLATPTTANFAAFVTGETGTGAVVFGTSPTLVTPALGTPTALVLTSATGLPVSTGLTGAATGIVSFLGAGTSATLAGALSDETGTGAATFATSPTLSSPLFNGYRVAYVAKPGDYTITATDQFVECVTNPSTQTLPSPTVVGETHTVKNTQTTNTCTVATGSGTIDGDASVPLINGTITVTADGTNWRISGSSGCATGVLNAGGMLYFPSAGTCASTLVMAQYKLVIGGGTGSAPATLASSGATTTLLHGNASGAPTFSQVNLATDVTGTLPIANFTTGTPTGAKFVRDDGVLAVPGALGSACAPVGGATQILTDDGSGDCTSNADAVIASGVLSLGLNTSELGAVKFFGSTSGNVTIQPLAVAGTNIVWTLPASTDTFVGQATTDTLGSGHTWNGVPVTDTYLATAVKPAVAVVATANLTLSGEQTIDGQLTAGSLVLATAQSTASQNGPWVSAAGAWARPGWFTSGSTIQAPQFSTTFVRLGTSYQGSTWRMTTAAVTIDTTSETWTQTPLFLSGNSVSGVLPFANLTNASGASILLGRGASGAGVYQEITLGTNLSMSGTTLNATGGGGGTGCIPSGAATQVLTSDGAGACGTANTGFLYTGGIATLGVNVTTAGKVKLFGGTSGDVTLTPTAAAGTATVLTLPATTDTLSGKATVDIFTNKTYDTAGTGNVFKINGTSITAVTGTTSVALADSPTFTTQLAVPIVTTTSATNATSALTLTSAAPTISGGSQTSVVGSAVNITASNASAGNVTGAANGGAVVLLGGNAARNTSGNASGGSVNLTAGTSIGSNNGGGINITGGVGTSTGGTVTLAGGAAGSGTATGGFMTLAGGNTGPDGGATVVGGGAGGTGAGNGGDLTLTGGAGNSGAFSGSVTLKTPNRASASAAISTAIVTIQTGTNTTTATIAASQHGDTLTMLTGAGQASSNISATSGHGGDGTLTTGAGGAATAASGTHLAGRGGNFTLTTGAGGAATAGGTPVGAAGGTLAFVTGAGGAATAGTGGAGAPFTLTTGVGGAGATAADGGAISLTSGAGGAGTTTNANGGNITLQAGIAGAGAGTAGTNGTIIFKTNGSTLLTLGTGSLGFGTGASLWASTTAPSALSFGTSPSLVANNGTMAFTINVGTGGAVSTGSFTMPASTTGWACGVDDVTTPDSNDTHQTASTTTSVSVKNYNRATGSAKNWDASDVLVFRCVGY